MKIKVTDTLKQFDGSDVMDVDKDGKAVAATIRAALLNVLLMPVKDEVDGEKKAAKCYLAMEIYKKDEVELSAEECSLLKELVGKSYAPLIVGQLFNILDGKEALPS